MAVDFTVVSNGDLQCASHGAALDLTGSAMVVRQRHASQVPVDRWYEIIGNPTLADAILDRVIPNAYRIDLSGESLRKRRTALLDA
jgi:hypothetical protein